MADPKRALWLLCLVLASVPVALGATHAYRSQGPKEFVLGDLGRHRMLDDGKIFEFRGEMYAVRYEEYPIEDKDKLGMVKFHGRILATRLRDELKRKSQPPAAGAGAPRKAPEAVAAPTAGVERVPAR